MAQVFQSTLQTLAYDAENRLVEATNVRRTVTIQLTQGWNSFSLPVQPDDSSIGNIFPTFAADIEQISRLNPQTSAPNAWQHYAGNAAYDDFTTLEHGKAYQIYVKNPAGLSVSVTSLPTMETGTRGVCFPIMWLSG